MLVTVTGKKLPIPNAVGTKVANYLPDVATATDYYPFAMALPGRTFSPNSEYRNGFNEQEKSTEIDLAGNSKTTEFWQYDSRIRTPYSSQF